MPRERERERARTTEGVGSERERRGGDRKEEERQGRACEPPGGRWRSWADTQLGKTPQREAVAEDQPRSPPGSLPLKDSLCTSCTGGGSLAHLSPVGAGTEVEPALGTGLGRTATHLPTWGPQATRETPARLGFPRCRAGVGICLRVAVRI